MQEVNGVRLDSSDRGGHVLRSVINLIIKLDSSAGLRF